MRPADFRKSEKRKLLVTGVLPPPVGGMSTYYQMLLGSSITTQVNLTFIQSSSQKRSLSSTGKVTLSNLFFAVLDVWHFTRALFSHRPEIVHIGTAAGLSFVKNGLLVWVAKALGYPVLLHPHCSLSSLYDGHSKSWHRFFSRVFHSTAGVIAISAEWSRLNEILPGQTVYFLPNAVDLKLYREAADLHLAGTAHGTPVKILYLGNIGKAKGSFDLIQAAARVRALGLDIQVNLVGEELTVGEKSQLDESIRLARLGEAVTLQEPACGEVKLGYLKDADIFVHPSYAEGMPMAVLEAMACGLPVVATRVGGIPELVISGKNGLLVEPGQTDQLAEALITLAKDGALRQSMGEAGYALAREKYDLEQHVSRLVGVYDMVLSQLNPNE